MPYHTVLGVHELFLMEAVHSRKDWNEKQKFLATWAIAHWKGMCNGSPMILSGFYQVAKAIE